MPEYMLFIVILLPMLTGVVFPILPIKKRSYRLLFLEILVVLNSVFVWMLLLNRPESGFTLAILPEI